MTMMACLNGCLSGCVDENDGDESSIDTEGGTDSYVDEINTYTIEISVLVGGGKVEVRPQQVAYEEGQMVAITAVADSGWQFERWDGDFEAQTESTVNVRVEQNLSIEAYFAPLFSLTVATEGQGEVVIVPPKETYKEGEQPTVEAVPHENWIFDRWTGNLTGTANPETITMNADKSVTAVFVERL